MNALRSKRVDYLTQPTEAQYHLGHSYIHGSFGLQQDYMKAIQWLKTAAAAQSHSVQSYTMATKQNDAVAQCYLAFCYENGRGVEKNMKEAMMWYDKAVISFKTYKNANGDGKDIKEWHNEAVNKGSAVAQIILGFICEYTQQGSVFMEDDQEAGKWYSMAAQQGHAVAQYNLGRCYENGTFPAQRTMFSTMFSTSTRKSEARGVGEAVKWFRKAAEQGYAPAQHILGLCYVKGVVEKKDEKESVKWIRKAAEQDYAPAQSLLGFCYILGKGVVEDEKESEKWFRKAAEQGDADAQYNLGRYYENGIVVATDKRMAVSWYRKAAEQGHADAQHHLGLCYENGKGVATDKRMAVCWYRKAAEQGHADAQNNLGVCYWFAKGVAHDKGAALFWFRKAAAQGHADARICAIGIEVGIAQLL